MIKKLAILMIPMFLSSVGLAKHPEGHANGSQSTTGNPNGPKAGGSK